MPGVPPLGVRLRYYATTGARRKVRDLVLRDGRDDVFVTREDLARRYLSGDGIEIGAMSYPLRLPAGARARYVDRLPKPELLTAYELAVDIGGRPLDAIPDNLVDDAETLATFADASLDFVVANHVLEHLEDPVRALKNLVRVLRPGGILFLTLPNADVTWDKPRERTTVAHVMRDHEEGPEVSRRRHYEEWATFIEGAGPDMLETRVQAFASEDARHHFHVWGLEDFLELVRALDLGATLEAAQRYGHEFAVILRRG